MKMILPVAVATWLALQEAQLQTDAIPIRISTFRHESTRKIRSVPNNLSADDDDEVFQSGESTSYDYNEPVEDSFPARVQRAADDLINGLPVFDEGKEGEGLEVLDTGLEFLIDNQKESTMDDGLIRTTSEVVKRSSGNDQMGTINTIFQDAQPRLDERTNSGDDEHWEMLAASSGTQIPPIDDSTANDVWKTLADVVENEGVNDEEDSDIAPSARQFRQADPDEQKNPDPAEILGHIANSEPRRRRPVLVRQDAFDFTDQDEMPKPDEEEIELRKIRSSIDRLLATKALKRLEKTSSSTKKDLSYDYGHNSPNLDEDGTSLIGAPILDYYPDKDDRLQDGVSALALALVKGDLHRQKRSDDVAISMGEPGNDPESDRDAQEDMYQNAMIMLPPLQTDMQLDKMDVPEPSSDENPEREEESQRLMDEDNSDAESERQSRFDEQESLNELQQRVENIGLKNEQFDSDANDVEEDSSFPTPPPEDDTLEEAVAGRYRVCDMVHNKFYKSLSFTGKTLHVDECYVSCERRSDERVFSHIFKLVDWPCGDNLEGKCDHQGTCSAF